MKSVPKESLKNALLMTALAVIATILVATVDVQPVGVEGTNVGFASINTGFFSRYGQNETFYKISKIGGAVCIAVAAGFALFFVIQLIQRRSLAAADRNLTFLMILYVVTLLVYLLTKKVFQINYRPVLGEKGLESSFPSSHTILAWVVMVSAVDQWNIYIKNQKLLFTAVTLSFTVLLVVIISRLFSGVHWFTDIIGGILYGDTLIAWYRYAAGRKK